MRIKSDKGIATRSTYALHGSELDQMKYLSLPVLFYLAF